MSRQERCPHGIGGHAECSVCDNDPPPYRPHDMTDEELNKWIQENIMQDCWHDSRHSPTQHDHDNWTKCTKCKVFRGPSPEYCGSLDAVWTVLEKIQSVSTDLFTNLIWDLEGVMTCTRSDAARCIAEVCKEAWESK